MSGAKAPTGLSETSGCVAECMAMRLGAGAGCARRQKVAFAVAPTGETGSHFGRTPPSDGAQYVHRVSRVRQVIASYGLDVLIVVLALACAASTALRHDPYRPGDVQLNFEVAAVAAMVLTLLLRHRAPFGAPAATWLLSAALSFLDGRLIVGQAPLPIAGMVAAVLLGNLRSTRQARVGLALVASAAVVLVFNNPTHSMADFFFIPMLFAIGWLVGFALNERAEEAQAAEVRATQAERDREVAARVAVAEERGRIARELHDVVAHAVSVMVLQVGAVRHRMASNDTDGREALRNVEEAGRTALAEMRRLLDAMRRDGDELELVPHPGLRDVDSLLDDVRAAGLDVRLRINGDPVDLPPALDLSAYRIVQEALTNTLKHAGARHADVEVRYASGHLAIEVGDDGCGPATPNGVGHGLVGIGERVKIYGGDMSAGAAEAGGFVLRVHLPIDGR